MSNHLGLSKVILIKYSNGIRTLVPCASWIPEAIVEAIQNEMPQWSLERDENIKESIYVGNIVWSLESLLEYRFYTYQILLHPNDQITHPDAVLELKEPYDLGESDSVEDIQKFYPNYIYPYL